MSALIRPLIRPWQGVWPKIHPDAFVAENAVIIGDVEIGAGSSIWYNVMFRGLRADQPSLATISPLATWP